MKGLAIVSFLLAISATIVCGTTCQSPAVSILNSYTSTDASVLTAIAFISQFDIKCGGASPPLTANFYAEVEGKHLSVVRNLKGSFQVSWTEDVAKASRGDYKINLYDEDTFAVVRKGKGDIPPHLLTLTLNHPGAYTGPWLSSEHVAAILGIVVVYIALSCRSKLLS